MLIILYNLTLIIILLQNIIHDKTQHRNENSYFLKIFEPKNYFTQYITHYILHIKHYKTQNVHQWSQITVITISSPTSTTSYYHRNEQCNQNIKCTYSTREVSGRRKAGTLEWSSFPLAPAFGAVLGLENPRPRMLSPHSAASSSSSSSSTTE